MNKIKSLKHSKYMFKIAFNALMILQIVFIVLILLLSTYEFLHLINNNSLDFINPFVKFVKESIRFFFGTKVKASQPELDGELILFIIIDIIGLFIISQIKAACKTIDERIDKRIIEEKLKEEEKFNKQLQAELNQSIASNNNYILGFSVQVSPLIIESLQAYGTESLDVGQVKLEVLTKFVSAMQTIQGVKVSKDGSIILLLSSTFNNIDTVLTTAITTFARLKKEYRAKKIVLKSAMAIECYANNQPVRKIYSTVKPLIDLNLGADVLCYGNFKNRYALVKDAQFDIFVKGKYEINQTDETVYGLVRKV